MAWELNDREFESVLRLDAARRYSYFVRKVADTEKLWSLRNEQGWILAGSDSGEEMVPVWPHARFAEACASGAWAGCEVQAIDLEAWMAKWIPGMTRDRRQVAVFPVPGGKGVPVSPDKLRADLGEEISNYE